MKRSLTDKDWEIRDMLVRESGPRDPNLFVSVEV